MSKVILSNVGSLVDATTAANTINTNSAAITTAMDNTLSLDGTLPNSMDANIDMNSNRILNLPAPVGVLDPVRLTDLNTLNGGGTISVQSVPAGGTTLQYLGKNSNANYDMNWITIPVVVPPTLVTSIGGVSGVLGITNGLDMSGSNLELTAARRTLPTVQNLTTGVAATYTTPTNCLWIEVYMVGGGGGGAGCSSTTTTSGTIGVKSTFNSIDAAPGSGAIGSSLNSGSPGGAGGTGGTGTATRRVSGNPGYGGGASNASFANTNGAGGNSAFFGGGGVPAAQQSNLPGGAAQVNTGGGGGGAYVNPNNVPGGGGGAGESVYLLINSPSPTYTYTIGTGGAGGVSTQNGGAGGTGMIQVIEHYGS